MARSAFFITEVKIAVVGCGAVGSYYGEKHETVKIWVEMRHVRAAPGKFAANTQVFIVFQLGEGDGVRGDLFDLLHGAG